MSKIIIALCLLAIVLFVAAQEAAAPKKNNDLKNKLVQKIKDKVKEKIQQRKRPAVKRPLKERIANLKEKIAKLETKRSERKAAKKDQKPKSRQPKSRKPRSDKPKKDQKPKSRKPRSDKPRTKNIKPRSRKPKSEKTETQSDSEAGAFTLATVQKLFKNLPAAKAQAYFPHLEAAMNGAGINTCLRRAAFLAQVGHESGELQWFEEFASGAAYENRKDLGNTQPGDGKRYKGRGPIQVTGRANYRAAGKALGVDFENNPTWAALPQYGFKIAAWFWNSRSLSSHADKGTQAEFDIITKRINGGTNGKDDRDRLWKLARAQMGC